MLSAEEVEVNALAQGALRRIPQWPWIELTTGEADTLYH